MSLLESFTHPDDQWIVPVGCQAPRGPYAGVAHPGDLVTNLHRDGSIGMLVADDGERLLVLWAKRSEMAVRVTHVQSVSRKLGVTFTSLPSVTIPESIDVVTAPMTTEA